jgi:glycolate oxidase FAD binding subunit
MSVSTDWRQSSELAHFGGHRPGGAGDAVDGAMPAVVIEPTEPAQLAAAMAWVTRERLKTIIRGRGSKLSWGRTPSHVDVILSTAQLNREVVHRHGDLTATVQAGITLSDLNRQLASQQQWLPLDSPFDNATIGGLIATNDSGPLRHRYGTPRDLLIGITLAMTDGRIVRSGGHVVKNVAGYDLAKLVSGSFGTIAAIVDATFKLLPIPQTSQTILASYADGDAMAADAASLAASQLEPVTLDARVVLGQPGAEPQWQLAVCFATSPEATRVQVVETQNGLATRSQQLLEGAAEGAWWSEQVRHPWTLAGSTIRLSWLPAALADVLRLVEELQRASGVVVELTARTALGAGFVRLDGEDAAVAKAIEKLRSRPIVTNVVVLRHGGGLKKSIDPWGTPPDSVGLMQTLKRSFDPAGVLNAGRGPI